MSKNRQKPSLGDEDSSFASSAFIGSATISIADAAFRVQALCWPIVPTAWRSLAQAWESVGGWRSEAGTTTKMQSRSWIGECAAQLGSPFRGTTAEESTVAAIFTRTPMSVAICVLDDAQAAEGIQRQALLNCLSSYDKYVNVPGRLSCCILVARGKDGAANPGCVDAFAYSRRRLPDSDWLQDMELRSWTEPVEPLPLEAAHVMARSVARYCVDREMANPIVDAVRGKLAHPLELLDRLPKKRR